MDIRIKNYLSWSQYNLFLRSPEQYRQVYILGKPSFKNVEMEFGSKIASGLEQEDLTGDAEIDFCKVSLPEVDESEKEMTVKVGDMKLLIKMDGYNKDHTIYEYKTGHVAWTQKKVDKWEQLTFYAYVYWLIKGVVPNLYLIWIPTQKINGEISLTKEAPVVFHTKRTTSDFYKMAVKTKRVWNEIGKLVKEELYK
jgi:hypothetical protein